MSKNKLFGTDGIRGTPGEYPLTDEMILKIGKAAAQLLHNQRKIGQKHYKIIIGKDTRLSCEVIEKLLVGGISACGVDVSLVGIVSTPGLSFLTRRLKADMGIMISASHNRAEENGIKFFSSSGYKLSDTQEKMMEELVSGSFIDSDKLSVDESGLVTHAHDGERLYIDFLKSKASNLDLSELKIVVDCAHGALYSIAVQLFKELGAKVFVLNDQPNGKNINLNCGALHPENMAKAVLKNKADIGFSYDGDGDRVILSDELGNILDGDFIMAIVGTQLIKENKLPMKSIVATVMSNFGLEEALLKAGGKLIRTDVGDRNVTEALLKNNLIFGGEQAGHIIFLQQSTSGDALIVSLEILKVMQQTGRKLSALSSCMKKYPQILVNIKVKEKKPFEEVPVIRDALKHSLAQLKDNGRILLRYSGTETLARVMVEGKDKAEIDSIAHSLASVIKQELGV
ncbi:MAG: phosphoglucosamine mutase [Candidatus Omnitrophota bacterium]|jgi:phosphoglucosamine mutase